MTNKSNETLSSGLRKRKGEKERVWTYVSARMIRVRLAFSMVNFVLPSCPAIRPVKLEHCGSVYDCLHSHVVRVIGEGLKG